MQAVTYSKRIERFQAALAGQADLAFFPISADLQYLAGVQREMPTFGAVRHPGCSRPAVVATSRRQISTTRAG